MARRSVEDYLKTVHVLSRNGTAASTSEISRILKVAPASVTEMLKKLAENGYVDYSPYKGSALTAKGIQEAQKIARKHRLLERFLSDVLHIRSEEIHKQACEMEHALSDEAEESLCRFLKHPDKCPDDGKMIPPCNLPFASCEECIKLHNEGLEEVGKRTQNLVALSDLKEGQFGRVSFIRGGHNVLQRLLDMGLTPGTRISVLKAAPFEGPVEVTVRGSKLALGRGIASKVFVDMEKQELKA